MPWLHNALEIVAHATQRYASIGKLNDVKSAINFCMQTEADVKKYVGCVENITATRAWITESSNQLDNDISDLEKMNKEVEEMFFLICFLICTVSWGNQMSVQCCFMWSINTELLKQQK